MNFVQNELLTSTTGTGQLKYITCRSSCWTTCNLDHAASNSDCCIWVPLGACP